MGFLTEEEFNSKYPKGGGQLDWVLEALEEDLKREEEEEEWSDRTVKSGIWWLTKVSLARAKETSGLVSSLRHRQYDAHAREGGRVIAIRLGSEPDGRCSLAEWNTLREKNRRGPRGPKTSTPDPITPRTTNQDPPVVEKTRSSTRTDESLLKRIRVLGDLPPSERKGKKQYELNSLVDEALRRGLYQRRGLSQ